MAAKQWGGKREGAGRPRSGKTVRASKAEQQQIIRATLVFMNFRHNFPDNLDGCHEATKRVLIDEGESEETAEQIASTIRELFQTPFYGAPQLPQPAAALLRTLSTTREPVATVYRRLNWGRQKLEQTISAHRAELERAGLHMHVATHAEASGRMERYITIDGTRYSALSRDARAKST